MYYVCIVKLKQYKMNTTSINYIGINLKSKNTRGEFETYAVLLNPAAINDKINIVIHLN